MSERITEEYVASVLGQIGPGYAGTFVFRKFLERLAAQLKADEQERERLREALKPFCYDGKIHTPDHVSDDRDFVVRVTTGDIRRARAAMEPTPPPAATAPPADR